MRYILYAIGVYLGVAALLYFVQKSFTYFPDRTEYTPEEAGVPEMKVVEFETADGLIIHSWFRAPHKTGMPTVVYLHGNAGNIAHRAFAVKPFLKQGYGVLLLTYRGYSGNPGSPSEEGLYHDARAALGFLLAEGIKKKCIVLYGNSIGASVAVQMATEYNVGALVLQSPFSSLEDVARIHYAFFLPFIGMLKEQYNSLEKADQITQPVYIIHGKDDNIIPPELSRKLYEALPQPKEADYLPGRGHNDLFEPDRVIRFIEKYVKCR